MKNEPKIIYLHIDEETDGKDFNELDHEFTLWSEKQNSKDDIQFVNVEALGVLQRKIYEHTMSGLVEHWQRCTIEIFLMTKYTDRRILSSPKNLL